MTQDEIEAARALCDAASDDGWSKGGEKRNRLQTVMDPFAGLGLFIGPGHYQEVDEDDMGGSIDRRDAALAALPAALDALEEARRERDEAGAKVEAKVAAVRDLARRAWAKTPHGCSAVVTADAIFDALDGCEKGDGDHDDNERR